MPIFPRASWQKLAASVAELLGGSTPARESYKAHAATPPARFPVLQVVDASPTSVARYLLEGSVRRSGPRVRINVQLRDAARGERVWAERFDREFADPFVLQDDVASAVVGRVEAAILAHETRRIALRPVDSLSAHELWLRARRHSLTGRSGSRPWLIPVASSKPAQHSRSSIHGRPESSAPASSGRG